MLWHGVMGDDADEVQIRCRCFKRAVVAGWRERDNPRHFKIYVLPVPAFSLRYFKLSATRNGSATDAVVVCYWYC